MKKSLYNIEAEYLEIANQLEDGELSQELETALAINQSELQGKAVAYAYVIKESEDTVSVIDAEIKRLTALKKTEQNKATRLKDTISNAMNLYGITEIKTKTLKLNFRKSEGVVCTFDNPQKFDSWWDVQKSLIGEEFVTTVPELSKPNLTAIKKAIKEGVEVEGFEIEERYSLQIK
jgi:lipid II:glycine glycyltransferase (peptidoglycan interpeptide bridge formation enzyme)